MLHTGQSYVEALVCCPTPRPLSIISPSDIYLLSSALFLLLPVSRKRPEQCGAGVYFTGEINPSKVVTFITCSFVPVSVCAPTYVCTCKWR